MFPRPKRLKSAACAAAVACLLLPAAPALADDLLQVFNAARDHDAGLRAAQAQLDAAQPRAAQADALFLPNVSAQGSAARSQTDPPTGQFYPEGTHLRGTTHTLNLNLRQPVFNRVSSADVAKSRVDLEQARSEYEATLQDFILRVAQAYFDVLSARDVLEAARQSRASISAQLTSAQRNFDAGTGIVTDVRDAQARHDLALAQELAADNELRIASLALARLVGKRGVQPNALAKPVSLPAAAPDDVEAWVAASAEHPGVRRAEQALELARLDTQRAQAGRLPTVDVVGSLGYNRLSGTGGNFDVPGTTRSRSIGVELNVPIFAGNAIQNRVLETSILEGKAGDDLEAARRNVAEATERAFFQLQSARAQAGALEAAEASSLQSLDGTQRGYKAGVRVSLDVLNAQAQLFETQRDLAKARYAVLMGHLKLRQAAGGLKPEHIESINALIARQP